MRKLTVTRDQELRFTVHDSPDYYQLKVSVFNDDKKTDLIGEGWVNLQEVIVPGGGTNDLWHNLACKGKYAGEIRIEITYYDTRPKQEKPERTKQADSNGVENGRDSLKGPRQPKAPVKRRPLPSDPVTGAPPPPQPDNSPPLPYQPPVPVPENVQTPPRGYQPQYATPDHVQASPRGYQAPSAIPDHVHTPTRGQQSPHYIPNQSPLQNVEYNTLPPRASPSQGYGSSAHMNGYASSPAAPSNARDIPHDRHDMYQPQSQRHNSQGNEYFEEEDPYNSQEQYNHSPYELPQLDEFGSPPSPGGPPPPPPVHRTRNNSHHVSPQPAIVSQGSYGFPADSRPTNAYEIPSSDPNRHSMPAYSHSSSYQSYAPPVQVDQFRRSANGDGYDQQPPRSQSFDSRFDGNHYSSMQPTVEDESPHSASYSGSYNPHHDDRKYERDPSPAPLNLSGRGSSASGLYSSSMVSSVAPSTQYSNGYGSTASPVSFNQSVSSMTSYNTLPRQGHLPRKFSDDLPGDRMGDYGTPDSYGLPPVPPTLVAGMDPSIAQEISDRIYAEKRASFNQSAGNSPRTSKMDSQPNRPHPLSFSEAATPFVPAAATYDERQSRIATATVPVAKPRALSPSPARKSVSPAPESPERRLSGVPFGPDSYNILNQVGGSAPTPSLSGRYNVKDNVDEKIITHDGREIDPSDHIPASNYAPLLESKGPKYASQLPDRNYRAPQQNSSGGRTPLKQAQRPHSMVNSSPNYMNHTPPDHPPPQAGRNRLQKKANRMTSQPAPQSSPLGPVSSYQDNSYTPSPRANQRSHTSDYPNENYAPQNYGSPGYRGSSGPPVPEKIPHNPHSPQPPPNSADAWALLEEMKNIDLGSGRARRRGY